MSADPICPFPKSDWVKSLIICSIDMTIHINITINIIIIIMFIIIIMILRLAPTPFVPFRALSFDCIPAIVYLLLYQFCKTQNVVIIIIIKVIIIITICPISADPICPFPSLTIWHYSNYFIHMLLSLAPIGLFNSCILILLVVITIHLASVHGVARQEAGQDGVLWGN